MQTIKVNIEISASLQQAAFIGRVLQALSAISADADQNVINVINANNETNAVTEEPVTPVETVNPAETTTSVDPVSEPESFQPCNPRLEEILKNETLYVRRIMENTRKRFGDSSNKDNSTAPGYVTFHKALTSEFKRIAGIISGGRTEKPTELHAEEIIKFEDSCDELSAGEGGKIEVKCPY